MPMSLAARTAGGRRVLAVGVVDMVVVTVFFGGGLKMVVGEGELRLGS